MYNFLTDTTTICDIDFFKKAPEEYVGGAIIDEQTNIFTLGALIIDFFGNFSDEEIYQRYCNNEFTPCSLSNWQLSTESYRVATKAVRLNKSERYSSFAEFFVNGRWQIVNCLRLVLCIIFSKAKIIAAFL